MPTYDYRCNECERLTEEIRVMRERNESGRCSCGGQTERVIIAAPATNPWDPERRFPNLRKEGDGAMSFPSRAAYETYLKKEQIGELGIKAPLKRPHGSKVLGVWDQSGIRLQ